MTSRERMDAARWGRIPGRIPVTCRLALGHCFLEASRTSVEVWSDPAAVAETLVEMRSRCGFDGILCSAPSRAASENVLAIARAAEESLCVT